MAKRQARYQPWEIRDFSAGQVEKLNDNILPDNAASECRNFTSSRFGGLSKRKGYERLNTVELPGHIQGMHPYYARTTNIRRLITMAQGLGYLWNGTTFERLAYEDGESLMNDDAYPLIGTMLFNEALFNHPRGVFPLDPSAIVMFEDAVNYVVSMNGVDRPWKWGGNYLTFLADAPAKGRFPVLHKEKLFCVDADEPSTLRWSESFDPEDWPEINYWDVRKGDGDEITNLQKFVDDLLVFKNRSIHALKGTSLDDFSMQEISSDVGCVGPLASVTFDLKVYFISEYGLYVTNGMNVLNVSDMVIPDTWEAINKQYIHKAVATVWNDLIWFALPYGTSTVNNIVLTYDPKKQSFFPMTNIAGSCYTYYNDGSGEGVKLYGGQPVGGFVNIMDQGHEDNGAVIDAYWKGKYFDMGAPEVEKKSRVLFVQDSPKTGEIVDIAVSVDYGDYNNLTYHRTEGLTREYLFDLEANRWRYVSPLISHNSTGPCEVRGVVIPYKSKPGMGVRTVE